ncbi:hypothetical protein D3C71_1058450 [compost metagenome]
MAQHHFGGQDLGTRVHIVLAGVLGGRAVGGLEHGDGVAQVRARGDADAADLCGQCVGHVVAVEVQRGDHAVFGGTQQDLLQERVGDAVLDGDFLARLGVLELHPRAAVDQLGAEFLGGQVVAPVTEATFGELHDVALVDQGHAGLVVVDGVLEGLAHEALGAFARNRFDADARGVGEADLLDAHLVLQELDELLGLVAFGFELDAGVDVFRVLAEDHHVGLVRLAHRAGHALEVLDGPQADVQVEFLAQRHVQRADAAADGRGQRALDGHHVVAHRMQGFLGEPDVGAVDLGRLLTGVDLHPVDLLLAAVGLGHCGVHHLEHHRRDVQPGAVAFDERNDRLIGHIERIVSVDRDLLAFGRDFDVLIAGHEGA